MFISPPEYGKLIWHFGARPAIFGRGALARRLAYYGFVPAEFAVLLKRDYETFGKLIRELKITGN